STLAFGSLPTDGSGISWPCIPLVGCCRCYQRARRVVVGCRRCVTATRSRLLICPVHRGARLCVGGAGCKSARRGACLSQSRAHRLARSVSLVGALWTNSLDERDLLA